jgi:hypothetical protein
VIQSHRTDKKRVFYIIQQTQIISIEKVPFTFIIIPLNSVLLPPTERRTKPRCCCLLVEVGVANKVCIRLSAENDPESE